MSLVETCVLWGTPLIHWQAGFVHLLCTEATCPAGQVSAHRQPGRAQAWRARGLSDGGAHTLYVRLVAGVPCSWPMASSAGPGGAMPLPPACGCLLKGMVPADLPDPNAGVPQGLSGIHP